MKTTTLEKIRYYKPCEPSWKKLLRSLGKTEADNDELPFDLILKLNGWRDTVWCLRTLDDPIISQRVALRCARLVQHLMTDKRSIDCLDMVEKYLNGEVSRDKMLAAADSAYTAYTAVAAVYVAAAVDESAVYAADAADAAAYVAEAAAEDATAVVDVAYAAAAARDHTYAVIADIEKILLEELTSG